jgi:glycolate oxidase iron-sulfur subunit
MKNAHGRTALERHRRDISRCVRCGACSSVCPSFLADRRESRSPRGRMALIEAVVQGLLPVSQLYADRLATCVGCLACEAACASGVPATTIIAAAKEEAVRETGSGVVSAAIAAGLRHPLVMRSLAWLAPVALHFGNRAISGRRKSADREIGGRGDSGRRTKYKGTIAFFPGCAVRYFQRDIEIATTAVLEALGYEVVVPRGLQCCGRPFLSLGDREVAVHLARKNWSVLSILDVDAVVTACASCGLTFKKEYPELLAGTGLAPVAVLDIHEFLRDQLGALGLEPLARRATWHDPCHLGRGQGLAGTARGVLRAVPGITLTEMTEPARCCGFGGVMRATHPSLSAEIGETKAKDIRATGADLVVTGCPGCRMQIEDSLRRIGMGTEIIHTVQVIAAALPAAGQRRGMPGGARHGEEKEYAAAAGSGMCK